MIYIIMWLNVYLVRNNTKTEISLFETKHCHYYAWNKTEINKIFRNTIETITGQRLDANPIILF